MPVSCFGNGFIQSLRRRLRKKSPDKTDENPSEDCLPSPEMSLVTQAAPQELEDLWMGAEWRLKQNETTKNILTASAEILQIHFGLNVQTEGITGRELCGFLDTKNRELEENKWVVHFGGHKIKVEQQLTRAFQNVLMVKDVFTTAASASPPAAIACAGVTVGLLFVVQAFEQHECLLQGIELTSALIPRLHVMKDSYAHSDEGSNVQLKEKFKENLLSLYSKILEFQARALCYLYKHTISRAFRNMFKQDAWDDLLKDIKRLEDSAKSFTSLIHNADTKQRLDEIQASVDQFQIWKFTSTRDERMKKFFKQLYTCPYRDRKDRNDKRVPGTCNWFTSHDRFHNWEQSDHSSLLWVSADPGCGKSVLAKYLVDEFLPNSTRTVCYFFFKDDFSDQKSASNAFAAILRQLFMVQPHLLSDSVMDKLDTGGDKLIGSFSDLWNILMTVATGENVCEIICVLDALDECQADDRMQLIEAVREFYLADAKRHNLKFLITSRPYDHIRRGFHKLEAQLPTIHLSGEGEVEVQKISREIDLVIEQRVRDISAPRNLKPDQLESLRRELMSKSKSQRTYLWVSLTLNVIENMTEFTNGEIRKVIHHVPQNVNEAYNKILNRGPNREKAKRLLHIITAARRPLSLKEVSVALAFSAGAHHSIEDICDHIETDDQRIQATIRDLCGLFLVVVDSNVYLLHQTAKEFLVRNNSAEPISSQIEGWEHSLLPEMSHQILAEACTLYLVQENIREGPTCTFLDYAAQNWVSHFRAASIQSKDPVMKRGLILCEPESRIYETWSYKNKTIRWGPAQNASSLIIASYLGLAAVVHQLLEVGKVDVDSEDSDGRTPLSYAAEIGHEAVVKLLLDMGKVDVDSKDSDIRTPLSSTARNGHEAVVKLLLDTGKVDVDSKDSNGRTPLSYAARNGHEAVAKLLLDTGKVDMNSKDSDGRTPLSYAARNGNEAFWLSSAARNGHETVVKLLLSTGKVDVDSEDSDGRTPLSYAAQNGHEAVVKLLLDTGKVDVDSKDSDGRTPLSYAAWNGHEAVVKLLLDTGKVDVDSKDSNGLTPLSYAAQNGHEAFWLSSTAGNGQEAVVKLLLDTEEVDVDSKDSNGRTPLSYAAEIGHKVVMKLLLSTGKVDVDSKDADGRTPLSYAARYKRGSLMKGKKLSLFSSRKLKAFAARNEHEGVVKLLLDTGKVDVNSKDSDGRTPLSYAAGNGSRAIVKLLSDAKERGISVANNQQVNTSTN